MTLKKKGRFVIEKQSTTATTTADATATTADTETSVYTTDDEYYTDSEDENELETQGDSKSKQIKVIRYKEKKKSGKNIYNKLSSSNYKKPLNGTRQENMSKEVILSKIMNTIPLKTIQEKRYLEKMPLFKTWIKYYNTETKQFRTGGLLVKVSYPDYITLINTSQKLSWNVQLQKNIIYIPDPRLIEKRQEQHQEKIQQEKQRKEQEEIIKNKLLELYKKGKLIAKK